MRLFVKAFCQYVVNNFRFEIPLGKELFYFFALMQKSNKKIKPANKKAEILNVSLKSRNSRVEFVSLKKVLAQTALIF